MLNELFLALFLTQVGTVAAVTACIVGVMTLFYAETIALYKCDPERPLEAPVTPLDVCVWGYPSSHLERLAGDYEWTLFKRIY